MTNSVIFENRSFFSLWTLLLFALIFSILFDWLHFPLAWFLIPLLVAIIFSTVREDTQPLPNFFGVVGQGIIAVVTANRFSWSSFVDTQDYILPLLGCIFLTGILSVLNSYLIYRFANIDRLSSFLGSIPGASSSLVAMSEEMGANAIAVTVLQYVRILLVSLIVPNVVGFYFNTPSTTIINSVGMGCDSVLTCFSHNTLNTINNLLYDRTYSVLTFSINLIIVFSVVFIGIKMGQLIKIPSSLFLSPFLCGLIIFSIFPVTISPIILQIGLFMLGLSTGVKCDRNVINKLLKAVFIETILVIILIITCFFIGYEFHLFTQIDTMTSLLGTTPGGLNTMTATALELGGDSSIVLTMQMIRMFFILTLCPLFANSVLKNQPQNLR